MIIYSRLVLPDETPGDRGKCTPLLRATPLGAPDGGIAKFPHPHFIRSFVPRPQIWDKRKVKVALHARPRLSPLHVLDHLVDHHLACHPLRQEERVEREDATDAKPV